MLAKCFTYIQNLVFITVPKVSSSTSMNHFLNFQEKKTDRSEHDIDCFRHTKSNQ